MLTLSEMDIDSLLQNGSLSINKPINWKMKDSHYKFSVPIEGKNSLNHHKIELVGTKNPRTIHYTFAIILDNNCIRRLCPFKIHGRDKNNVGAPHKHKWTDDLLDGFVYSPTDITEPKDINKTFFEFCKESFIQVNTKFDVPPATQYEFPINQ